MTLTAGSLFSGVGMFDYAFAVAGFDILFQVEIDTYCQKVLKKHAPTYWPNAKIHADVCGVGRSNLPSVDVLFGGFPCTDISVAGRGEGIRAGTRSGLWFEFKRIIGEVRPRAVLLENVAAITRKDGIIVISDLAEMGYDCKWGVISASDTGAPHLRERWWCIAISNPKGAQSDGRQWKQEDHGKSRCDGLAHRRIRGHDGIEMEYPYSQRCEELHPPASHWLAGYTGGGSQAARMGNTASDRLEAVGAISITCQQAGQIDPERFVPIRAATGRNEDQSRLGGISDGTAARMDGSGLMSHVFPVGPNLPQPSHEAPRMAKGRKNTNARLKALGNGGMPQIVYPIALELKALLEGGSNG